MNVGGAGHGHAAYCKYEKYGNLDILMQRSEYLLMIKNI